MLEEAGGVGIMHFKDCTGYVRVVDVIIIKGDFLSLPTVPAMFD